MKFNETDSDVYDKAPHHTRVGSGTMIRWWCNLIIFCHRQAQKLKDFMRKEMESVLEMEKMIASSPHNTATRGNRGPRGAGATPASGRKSKKVSVNYSVVSNLGVSGWRWGRMMGKSVGAPPRSEAERHCVTIVARNMRVLAHAHSEVES